MGAVISALSLNLRFNNGYAIHTFKSEDYWSCRVFPESLLEQIDPEQRYCYPQERANQEGAFLEAAGDTEMEAALKGADWITRKLNPEWAGKHEIYLLIHNLKCVGVHIYGQEKIDRAQISTEIPGAEAFQRLLGENCLQLSCEPSLFDVVAFRRIMSEFGFSEIGVQRVLKCIGGT